MLSDLAAVAGGRAVGRRLLAGRAERLQHGQRGFVAGPQAGFGFRRPRPRVLLEEPVRVLAPPGALADQLDLGRALAAHRALDERRERRDGARRDLAQRRPLVAEDARVAVLVGADRAADAHVLEHTPEDAHRVLGAGVLGVRLDPLEVGLGARALDLELGDEDGEVAGRALGQGDRPLGGEEVEAREVPDVVLVEEDDAR
jgi:hypothetical protein